MIEKREEILNSILGFSSPAEANHSACSVGFSQAVYRKPAGSVDDSWVLEIIAGKKRDLYRPANYLLLK